MLRLVCCGVLLFSAPALGQQGRLTARDSALASRILLAEDQRDSSSAAVAEGLRHGDTRVRSLAWRAAQRIRDPRFAARDSLPRLAAPPAYTDPAWRVRYRALTANRADCATLRAPLADSAWPVRLRATDLAGPECAGDSTLIGTFRAWTGDPPSTAARRTGEAGWRPAAHALLALARIAPPEAQTALPRLSTSPVQWIRAYAARAAGLLGDTVTLRRLAHDADDNVKEAAVEGLVRVAAHDADDEYIAVLAGPGYQAIRAAARALQGSPRSGDVLAAALATAHRLRSDSSETSRDARLAVLERISEFAGPPHAMDVAGLAADFDCQVAQAATTIALRLRTANIPADGRCKPLPIMVPPEAVALALGRDVRLRVTLADSSGGGSFTVRLRGDVAPIMAARVLALARSGYYNGLTWHRVEPDFVIQGGGPGANEYVGHPRYMRDELGTVPHVRGTVGMSTRGHDTGDAQWFVNLRDNLRLNRDYTIFAEVVEGIDVVDGILEGDVIEKIEVV